MTTQLRRLLTSSFTLAVILLIFPLMEASAQDPLPSWNEGTNKSAILKFVGAITDQNGNDFIPAADRIATFDMDGTLLVEKPHATVGVFSKRYVSELAKANPDLDIQPYKAIRENDKEYLARNFVQILNAAGAGLSQSEYRNLVAQFGKTQKHERFDRPYGKLFYAPMIELLNYLGANEFKVFIVSGSAQGFVRGFAQEVTGLPLRRMIGTQWQLGFQGDGFTRSPTFRNLGVAGPGKPLIIQYQIGQKPVFTFGNTSGDQQMFQFVLSHKKYKSLALWLDHDDEKREYSYDGRVKPIDGLLKVSMKRDFSRLFVDD